MVAPRHPGVVCDCLRLACAPLSCLTAAAEHCHMMITHAGCAGFHTTVIRDACRGLSKETVAAEELEWVRLGVSACSASDVAKKAR